MLGVVIENLIEITLLTNKMGVPRHAFLAFLNNGVMGSMFTAYKSPALVNLDWTTTFTPELLRKDLDLGLELAREMDVPMPVTAATREVLQDAFRRRHAAEEPGGISAEGFRRARRNHGARRRHEAHAGKQERADRVGELSLADTPQPRAKKGAAGCGPLVCISGGWPPSKPEGRKNGSHAPDHSTRARARSQVKWP